MSEVREFSTVSEFEYRSTLGTAFWVGGDSAADYLLHPVFLQFALLCLAVLALLDQGGGLGLLVGWQVPLIWLTVAVAVFVAGLFMMSVLAMLPRRIVGRRRFTPLILLPLVALGETVRAGMLMALGAGDWPALPDLMADFARGAVVVLILDVMHTLYVVPLHPLARRAPPPPRPAKAVPVETNAADGAAPMEPVEPTQIAIPEIRIAERSFAVEDILWIRTEDHYLNVVTPKGRSLLRAKLSDLQALQDGTIGLQVNRSQWVAFSAIAEVREEAGGQLVLRLVTGDDASVARSRRIMFKQMHQAWRQRRAG